MECKRHGITNKVPMRIQDSKIGACTRTFNPIFIDEAMGFWEYGNAAILYHTTYTFDDQRESFQGVPHLGLRESCAQSAPSSMSP